MGHWGPGRASDLWNNKKICGFFLNVQSRFAIVVLDDVVGSQRLAHDSPGGVLVSMLFRKQRTRHVKGP